MRYFFLILPLFTVLYPATNLVAQVTFKTDTVNIPCTAVNTFRIPVRVSNFTKVGSFQFALGWNPAQLDYQYISKGAANNPFFNSGANVSFDTVSFLPSGRLTFQWNRVGGLSVPDTTVLFYVAVKRLGGVFSPVTFLSGANAPLQTEVTDPQADDLPFKTIDGGALPLDNLPPSITCPLNLVKTVSGPTAITGIAPATVADNCSSVVVNWSASGVTNIANSPTPDASNTVFLPGMTTVTYKATDVAGMTATCSFTLDLQPSATSDTLTIILGGGTAACGANFTSDITALNFDSLGSLQFTVSWNPANLRFGGITTTGSALPISIASNFDTTTARTTGRFTFFWTTNALYGTTLNDGALLFRLQLKPLSSNLSGVQVSFTDMPTPREAVSSAVQPPVEVPVIYIPGQLTTSDNVGPTLQCPANINITNPAGVLTATVSNTAPVGLSDNCGGPVTLTYTRTGSTPGSGSGPANGIYNAGKTTVIYTAADNKNNTSTCSFEIVVDAGKPAPVSIDSINGNCTATEVVIPVRVSDFADLIGLTFSIKWDTTVLKFDTITDVYGGMNLSALNFQFYNSAAGGILQFLAADPINGWPNIPDGGVLFAIKFKVRKPTSGTVLEFTGFSEAVNSALNSVPTQLKNGSFRTALDTAPPAITCPANVTTTATTADCKAVVKLPAAQATDACSGVAGITASSSDTLFSTGSHAVIYTARDKAGNTATCQTTITVQGNNNGGVFLNCPAAITVNAPANSCAAAVNWTPPTFNAPCGLINPQITTNFAPGALFSKGDTTVRYTVQGSAATCSFKVSVRDVTAPVLTCPANLTIQANAAINCRAIAAFSVPAFVEACDQNAVLTSNHIPGDTLAIGVTTIEYSAQDNSGNTGSCSFTVTVSPISGLKITCPANIVRYAAPDTCGAIAEWNIPVKAVDICAKDTVTAVSSAVSGSFFPMGITQVTYRATDAQGNTVSCSFRITVSDTTAPVLTNCPQNLIVALPSSKCDTMLTWLEPVATDKCNTFTLVADTEPGIFGAGTHVVTFFAEDSVGNVSTCSFSITVEDKTPPVIGACPTDLLLQLPPSKCDTTLNWDDPIAVDNCQTDSLFSNVVSGSVFKTGETIVQYTARDQAGNTATCSFKVTILDKVPPVFMSCPKDTTIIGNGNCGALVSWKMPVATDNCTPQADIQVNASHPAMGIYRGTTDVRILARDGSGNYDTCAFRIIVSSSGIPGFVNVPANKTLSGCEAIVTWDTVKTINFCTPPLVTQTHFSGDTFPVGVTTVTYTAKDSIGNSYTASFTITVSETQPPAIVCPKSPIVLNAAGGIVQDSSQFITNADTVKTCDGVRLYFTTPSFSDNCGTPTFNQTGGRMSGALFPIGTDTLKYEATDKAGNKTTCRIPITIKALEALKIKISPLPACQGAEVILQADSFPSANVTYTWTGPQTNYPNAAKITVFSLNQGNAGAYSVQADINGCLTPKATGEVLLVQKPVAEDDMFMIEPASTDTFDMFLNDILVPLTDFTLTQVGPTPVGVTPLQDGKFQYVANPDGKPASFIYEMCSKTCPTLCDRATVTIDVTRRDCDFVPNIISPNDDGVNDYLHIPCIDSGLYPSNSIVIYNQWGDKVFEASPYKNDNAEGWKGELNNERGKDLPDGTYFYIFRPGPNLTPLKGFVDIFR